MSDGFAGPTTKSMNDHEGICREVETRFLRMSAAIKGTTTVAVRCAGTIPHRGYGEYLLMGKRRDNGKWTLPGGGMDDGEAAIAGALRELKEEAGIVAQGLKPLGSMTVEGRTGRKVEVHCFELQTGTPIETRTTQDPDNEVANWEWIDVTAGLPAEILDNLQSPRNVLLQKLGLQKGENK